MLCRHVGRVGHTLRNAEEEEGTSPLTWCSILLIVSIARSASECGMYKMIEAGCLEEDNQLLVS